MAEPVVVRSTVKSVSVFRAGAVVTRIAALPSGLWPDEVAIDGLPLALVDDTLRVSVTGGAGATLPRPTDVRVMLVVPPVGDSMLPPSQKEIQVARDEVERLKTKLYRINQEMAFLDRVQFALPPVFNNRPPRPAPAAAWSGALEWTGRSKQARIDEKATLEQEIRVASETLERLERREEKASATRDVSEEKVRKRVVIRLRDGGAPAEASLSLEYRVPGARWRPTYVVRMARDGRSALLGLRALVVQDTGEAWERVRLSLSTADLLARADLPELKSLRIGRKQPEPPAKAWRAPPIGAEMLFEGLDRAMASEPDEGKPSTGARPRPAPKKPLPKPQPQMQRAPMRPGSPPMNAPAMPPPAPPAAAAPVMSATTTIALGGMMAPAGRAASAPMADKAVMMTRSAPEKKKEYDAAPRAEIVARDLDEGAAGGGFADQLESPEPRERRFGRPDAATLRYSDLVMAGWNDEQGYTRGKLRPMTTADRLRGLDEESADTVESMIAEAAERAEQARYAPFPGETHPPEDSSGAYDYRYDAEGLVDVPSDGKIHSVPLFGRRAPVATTLVVVPRESTQAVRVAALKNPLDAPLLGGPAEIYLEDEFLVMSPIRTVPAGAELKVGLGVEEALKVARNTHFDEEKAGLLGGSATLTHKVEIEVASRMTMPVRVEIRERVPIKDDDLNKDVEITVGEPSPPWEDFDQAELNRIFGGKRWRFSLGAGETKKLAYSYTVKIDAKNELVGGNRRE